MKSISELGLDLERVEVRKRVMDFLMGANVEFKDFGLDSTDHKGKIIGYRNDPERPNFSTMILTVGDGLPFGWWRSLDKFDNIIYGVDSEAKKVFVHITDILISDILADTLVMFVKGKTISEPKVSNDWGVSKSYLSNSNGFKY